MRKLLRNGNPITLKERIKRKTDEVENNLLTIKNIEGRINKDESAIIEFRIENDILMEEIAFLDQRRKENE